MAAVSQRWVKGCRRGIPSRYHTFCYVKHNAMLCSRIVSKALKQLGMRPWMMQTLSMSAIGLCIGLWIQAKTYDQDSAPTPSGALCSWGCGRRRSG